VSRDIEDLIRTAQDRQAERAVPADRIRSALPGRVAAVRRRRRYGMLGATVAAAAVTAAVTVPTLVLRDGSAAPVVVADAPSNPPSPASGMMAAPTTVAQPAEIPLRYRPTWVPSGFSERVRQADGSGSSHDLLGPTVTRVWKKQAVAGDPWGGAEIAFYLRIAVPDATQALNRSGQQVDVNGAHGYFSASQGDGKSSVDWALGEHTMLMIATSHVEISKADLLKMARSVRPELEIFSIPVRLRWLPDGWATTGFTVSGPSATAWRAEAGVASLTQPEIGPGKTGKENGHALAASLTVVVGGTTDAPSGGQRLTVGGRPARHPVRTDEPGKRLIYLVVDLGPGRLMTLVGQGGGLTLDDLAKVAEHTEISTAGQDWLGH
jgi:hypothetical protein